MVVTGEQCECLGDEGGLGVPGPPLVQLAANGLGDLVCLVEVCGLDQVVACLEPVVDGCQSVLGPNGDPPPPVLRSRSMPSGDGVGSQGSAPVPV